MLRTILFRESGTHPEVREHLRALRESVLQITETVLDAAVGQVLDATRRRAAAQTFVSVLMDEANARRYGGTGPDVAGAAGFIGDALLTR